MNFEAVNAAAAYKASLFFNYYTAICLHEQVVSALFRYTVKFNIRSEPFNIPISVAHFILFTLLIPAVIIMFNYGDSVDPSVHLIRTVLFSILVMSLVVIVKALTIDFRKPNCNKRALLVSVLPRNLLFIMWACFMISRTLLPLDSVARSSEVAFYLLNILILVLAGIAHESVSELVIFEPVTPSFKVIRVYQPV
ncbi:hypothetical protein IW152_001797 [Coemansia sp. BCRC 34962]|nr:hypothetical protein IW152_001797 [Coemansia sp. BCRC 34962]